MPIFAVPREVPEWLKGPAWKAGIGASLSRVRIPSSLQQQTPKRSSVWGFVRLERLYSRSNANPTVHILGVKVRYPAGLAATM